MGGTKAGVSGRTPALKGPSEFAKGILTGPVRASREKHVSLTEPLSWLSVPQEKPLEAHPGQKLVHKQLPIAAPGRSQDQSLLM